MHSEDLDALLSGGVPPDFVLNSVYEIENVLQMVREVEDRIRFYKELKKYRTSTLDEKIEDLETRTSALRKVILNTMERFEPTKKSLNFPSIGKVVRRAGKPTWQLNDTDAMLEFLEKEGVKGQVVQTKEVINKKDVNQVLENYDEQSIKVPGVTKIPAQDNLSITFEEGKVEARPIAASPKPEKLAEALDIALDDL